MCGHHQCGHAQGVLPTGEITLLVKLYTVLLWQLLNKYVNQTAYIFIYQNTVQIATREFIAKYLSVVTRCIYTCMCLYDLQSPLLQMNLLDAGIRGKMRWLIEQWWFQLRESVWKYIYWSGLL